MSGYFHSIQQKQTIDIPYDFDIVLIVFNTSNNSKRW